MNVRYRLVRRLAEGGMGTVDLVVREEAHFDRVYAMKRLRPALLGDPDVVRMFRDEAYIAGRIQHANVVSVVDVGEDARGPYLVMDFINGVSLSQLIANADEPLPEALVIELFVHVARGLAHAHRLKDRAGRLLGLVHRDVSPQNILVGFDGVARLTDFGIAKVHDSEGTRVGVLKGKVGYMSPEQLRFAAPTARSDLYSLGVCLFEALAGQRMYGKADPEAIALAVTHEAPPDLFDLRQDVHPDVVQLLFRLLAKDPMKRPADADAVVETLEGILRSLRPAHDHTSIGRVLRAHFPGEEARGDALVRDALTVVAKPTYRPWRAALPFGVLALALALAFVVGRAPPPATARKAERTRYASPPEPVPVSAPVALPSESPVPAAPSPMARVARPGPRSMRRSSRPPETPEVAPASSTRRRLVDDVWK